MTTHLHSFSRIHGKPSEIPQGIWRIALRQAKILNIVHELRADKDEPIRLEISQEWAMQVYPRGDVELANHQYKYVFNEEAINAALTY